MSLNPPTEHQLLVFWVGLLVILVAARLLGAVMQRIGQPARRKPKMSCVVRTPLWQ